VVVYDPAMESAPSAGRESIEAWRPPVPGIREVLHATHIEHAYPPHTHDAWTVFIVDRGAIRYDLDRQAREAEPSMVSVLPPYVVHDGRAASGTGYRKRVLYLETSILGEELIGPAVDRPFLVGSSLRGRVSALHDALRCRDDALEAETRLAFLAERIQASLGGAVASETDARPADAAEMLRAYLDANCFEAVTLGSAARLVGIGETQLAKAFSATFGIAPHAYLTGRRLDAARRRILDGQPLADVAAEVGFCDQAHFTRRFQRFLGTPPGRFRAGIPDPA
jgi:AraC-like DNA-binding protein